MAGKEARKIYRSARWRTIREFVLTRDGFACQRCNRRAGLEVDHKLPISQGGHAWAPANLQVLCRACHIYKSVEERHIKSKEDTEREALKRELQNAYKPNKIRLSSR